MPLPKALAAIAALGICFSLVACRSAFVQADIVNHTGGTVQLIEVDYPDASFGTQQIAPGATYQYRFKILDSGPLKISFTGFDNKAWTATGPSVHQNQEGKLVITLDPNGKVDWKPEFSERH